MTPSQPSHQKAGPEPLRADTQLVLSRVPNGDDGGQSTILVLAPADHRAHKQPWKRITREFSFRGKLDPDWAVIPQKLDGQGPSGCMILGDPGGQLLETHLKNTSPGGLAVERVLRLGTLIAEALAGLHAQEIVHNDIRPGNILVDDVGQKVRLTGFGLASSSGQPKRSGDTQEFGEETLPYLAPEQTGRMNRSADHRSDLYSLGITLYEMLTGKPPFTADDPAELVHSHVARTPRAPSKIRSDIPAQISDIVMKLLAKPAEDAIRKRPAWPVTCAGASISGSATARFPAFRWGNPIVPTSFGSRTGSMAATRRSASSYPPLTASGMMADPRSF